VTVAAETARAYVDLRAFQTRLRVALRNVALQEETRGLARTRFEAGLAGERDVAQAWANVESTRARVPALQSGVRTAENRLAVLVGVAPGGLAEELGAELGEARPIPVPPSEVAVGAPADLLRRRADVRRAETARIGVARAELLPRLTLGGSLGVESEGTGDLFERDSGVFGIGPSLRWNLFDGGRLRRLVEARDARARQALVRWERTVLVALEEAENAMTAFVRERSRRLSLVLASTQARRAVALARTQYREGLTDFQAVVDTERTVASLEDELAQSEAAIATSAIALYKALGGGWEHVGVVAQAGGS
jgi:NodT family efflux transporter outer membrane factor (OMF) lipoprotein